MAKAQETPDTRMARAILDVLAAAAAGGIIREMVTFPVSGGRLSVSFTVPEWAKGAKEAG